MADAIEANLGKKPTQLSADAGYCCDANLAGDGGTRDRRLYSSAPGWAKHAGEGEGGGARVAAMRKNQGWWALQPLPLKKAAARAGVRTDQAGARLPVSLRGVEKVANERGLRPPGPHKYSEARPGRTRPWPHSQLAELRHLGNGATNDARKASTQPYIKPDARICCIRLSDWLERLKPHLAED